MAKWIYTGEIQAALTPEYDLRFSLAYWIQYITFNPRPNRFPWCEGMRTSFEGGEVLR